MAFYRCEIRIIGRGTGRSSVDASAYRNGQRLTDRRTGLVHDYGNKDRIDLTEVLAPSRAPAWAADPAELWNRLEERERRCDAQLAREVLISIPHQLPRDAGINSVRAFARSQFVSKGYPMEVSFHGFKAGPDGNRNWHAHMMAPDRQLGPEGWAPLRDRSRNRFSQLHSWRRAWADICNDALKGIGSSERVDHRRGIRTDEAGPVTRGPVDQSKCAVSMRQLTSNALALQIATSRVLSNGPQR